MKLFILFSLLFGMFVLESYFLISILPDINCCLACLVNWTFGHLFAYCLDVWLIVLLATVLSDVTCFLHHNVFRRCMSFCRTAPRQRPAAPRRQKGELHPVGSSRDSSGVGKVVSVCEASESRHGHGFGESHVDCKHL